MIHIRVFLDAVDWSTGSWKQKNDVSPPGADGGIPHTGIAAAEATLQAMSSDLARDTGGFERRTMGLRE